MAACYSPRAPAGAPCEPGAPACPSGQACVAVAGSFACEPAGFAGDGGADSRIVDARVDARVPVDDALGSGDSDGDGVPDDQDNCPFVANPGQENEDGDAYGDACDPCPPFADGALIVDSDGDGVPDACDPNPTTPGDQIVMFEGFHHGVPAGWTTGGSWVGSGDAVVGTTPAGSNAFGAIAVPRPVVVGGTGERVTASVQLLRIDSDQVRSYGLIGPAQLGPDTGIECEIRQLDATQDAGLIDISSGAVVGTSPFPFAVGDVATMTQRRDDNTYDCHVATSSSTATASGGDGSAAAIANPVIGLRIHGSDVSMQWFMVVAF
jgi:hypothetical protein